MSRAQSPKCSVQRLMSKVYCPTSGVESPASRVQHPESNIQSPASRVQSPESNVQHFHPEPRNSGIPLEKYKVIYTDRTVEFDSVQAILLQVILKRNASLFPFLNFSTSKCSVLLFFLPISASSFL